MSAPKTATPTTTRGLIEVEIGGQKRTLRFGMNTLSAFGDLYKDSPLDFGEQFDRNPVRAMRDMVYCALLGRKSENELPEDFTSEMVGDWIDDMAQEGWQAVQKTLLSSLSFGNPK